MNKYELENQIEVMQHFLNGGEVEYAHLSNEDIWLENFVPAWDWSNFKYRIKQPDIQYPVYAQFKDVEYNFVVKFISETEGYVVEDSEKDFDIGEVSCDWISIYNREAWKILPDYKEKPKLKTYYEVINTTGSYYNIIGTLYSDDELEAKGETYVKTGRSFELPDKG